MQISGCVRRESFTTDLPSKKALINVFSLLGHLLLQTLKEHSIFESTNVAKIGYGVQSFL